LGFRESPLSLHLVRQIVQRSECVPVLWPEYSLTDRERLPVESLRLRVAALFIQDGGQVMPGYERARIFAPGDAHPYPDAFPQQRLSPAEKSEVRVNVPHTIHQLRLHFRVV